MQAFLTLRTLLGVRRSRVVAGVLAAMLATGATLGGATAAHAEPPPPPPKQYYLHMTKLNCDRTEDWWFDGDEAYITVNGNARWGIHTAKRGYEFNETSSPPLDEWVLFSGNVRVQLWDNDTGIFDSDDLLGTLDVSSANVGSNQTFDFTEDGAHYTLTYDVVEV